jgi:tetratricopeptide (TPR) repeat protein
METLKKLSLLVILGFGLSTFSFSQDYKAIQLAFEKSYLYEYSGEYQKAIDLLKGFYSEDSYEVNLRLGWLSYMAGFFTESTAFYQKSIDLKPLSIEAKLGYVYPSSALGNWEQVKKQYNDILGIDPQNTIANYRLGSIYYGNEDFTSALKYFEKVVNLYPFDHDALLMYAWTNFKLGKLREAEVLFNKVLMNKPNDESAVEGLNMIK